MWLSGTQLWPVESIRAYPTTGWDQYCPLLDLAMITYPVLSSKTPGTWQKAIWSVFPTRCFLLKRKYEKGIYSTTGTNTWEKQNFSMFRFQHSVAKTAKSVHKQSDTNGLAKRWNNGESIEISKCSCWGYTHLLQRMLTALHTVANLRAW